MQTYWVLVRRELGSYFASLNGYVIISVVLFLIGFSFVDLLDRLNAEATDVPLTEMFFATWYFWLVLLLAIPLITMRSLAGEKAAGTFETLTTAPVGEASVVLAKFTSAGVVYLLMWAPLMAGLGWARWDFPDSVPGGFGMILSTFLWITLVGGRYLAMGIFASALTRSQSIAAMVSFCLGMGLFLLSYRDAFPSAETGWMDRWLTRISVIEHSHDFVRGVLDTRHVVFYVSLTAFFLFLTLKVLESRRWR